MSPTMLMTHIYMFIPNLSPELWNRLQINDGESLESSQTQSFPNVLIFFPFT